MSPVVLGDGYSYDDEILFVDKESPSETHLAVLGLTQEPVDCDECFEPIGVGIWAYSVEDVNQALHPRCLFKQPCKLMVSILYRGIR